MTADWWLGIGLGAGLALAYSLASLLTARYAARQRGGRFLRLYVGGMMVRMAAALVAVALVLVLIAVPAAAFIGAFLVIFMAGLVLEVILVYRGRWTSRHEA